MIIRPYTQSDCSAVEYIQYETYFLGKSGRYLGDNAKRFHKDIAYYFEKEPQSCFVAVNNGKVVGYLLGCLDDKNHNESLYDFVWKSMKMFFQLPFMHKKDRTYWWGTIRMVFDAILGKSGDANFKTPPNSGHIHINLLPEARGKNVGSKLLKTFFSYAKLKGVKTIHADSFQTRLNPNKNFWIKNGFTEYSKVKTSFWKSYYPQENIYVVCYVKRL